MRKKVSKFELWLLSRKWLWKRVVFDNGIVGNNYVRYDHRLLSYCEGMGMNGVWGTKEDAIRNCLNSICHE
ncbi:MAG: hypothetical protein JJE45_00355 [Prolixibacteraceae bacterium]|nr:hypothetical protein [Prolixibacteraceae bacterium]